MTRVPASQYPRIKLRAEKEAVLAREREVVPRNVFAAKPEVAHLFSSPLTFTYEEHSGPVTYITFSPFHRNLCLSVSTDASARIYNVLQPRPLQVTESASSASLFAAAWSPSRPLVFATASADGNLYIYDMKRSRGKAEVTLKVTTNKSAVHGVSFNPRSPELIATADAQGYVKIWRLSHTLSTTAPREMELLAKLAASSRSEEVSAADAEPDEGDDYAFDDDEDGGEE